MSNTNLSDEESDSVSLSEVSTCSGLESSSRQPTPAELQQLYFEQHGPPVEPERDEDALPPTNLTLLWIVVALGIYLFDATFDIILAVEYFTQGRTFYFILTTSFVLIPSVTIAFVCKWTYSQEKSDPKIPPPSEPLKNIRTLCMFLQLGPLLRYGEAFYHGVQRRRKQDTDYEGSTKSANIYASAHSAAILLSLFATYMEAASQVTLQVAILILDLEKSPGTLHKKQLVSIAIALISIAGTSTIFSRQSTTYKSYFKYKTDITWFGSGVQFLWFLFTISARVFALAVFASDNPVLIFIFCIGHLLTMVFYLTLQRMHVKEENNETEDDNEDHNVCFAVGKICYDLTALPSIICPAYIYLFTFTKIGEKTTRHKHFRLFFYVALAFESAILLNSWLPAFLPFTLDKQVDFDKVDWFRIGGVIVHYVVFFLGMTFMWIYYACFHPAETDIIVTKVSANKLVKWVDGKFYLVPVPGRNPITYQKYEPLNKHWKKFPKGNKRKQEMIRLDQQPCCSSAVNLSERNSDESGEDVVDGARQTSPRLPRLRSFVKNQCFHG